MKKRKEAEDLFENKMRILRQFLWWILYMDMRKHCASKEPTEMKMSYMEYVE